MVAEGAFPKANGDTLWASEIDNVPGLSLGGRELNALTAADGALHVTVGTTTISEQVKRYSSLIVDAGTTLTFGTFGKFIIYVEGDMTINGAITLGARVGSALPSNAYDPSAAADVGASQTHTNGAAVATSHKLALVFPTSIFKTPFEGSSGGAGGTASGGGGGGGGGAGYGAGGNGGDGVGTGAANAGGAGGAGVDCVFFFVKGTITIGATAAISGVGAVGTGGTSAGVAGASGGGGGGAGAGGALLMVCGKDATLTVGATISMNGGQGGAGGNGNTTGAGGGGGGGGGGGYFGLLYGRTLTNAATITVAGGAFGAGGTGGNAGQNGVAGSAGLSELLNIGVTA